MDETQRPEGERLSVAFHADTVKALTLLQTRTGLKKVDLINRAVSLYEFFDAELREGKNIILRTPDGEDQLVRIVF